MSETTQYYVAVAQYSYLENGTSQKSGRYAISTDLATAISIIYMVHHEFDVADNAFNPFVYIATLSGSVLSIFYKTTTEWDPFDLPSLDNLRKMSLTGKEVGMTDFGDLICHLDERYRDCARDSDSPSIG